MGDPMYCKVRGDMVYMLFVLTVSLSFWNTICIYVSLVISQKEIAFGSEYDEADKIGSTALSQQSAE